MQACAREADEGAELGGGPLRRRGGAVAAGGVAGVLLEGEQLLQERGAGLLAFNGLMVVTSGFWGQGREGWPTLVFVSGSTSHMMNFTAYERSRMLWLVLP